MTNDATPPVPPLTQYDVFFLKDADSKEPIGVSVKARNYMDALGKAQHALTSKELADYPFWSVEVRRHP